MRADADTVRPLVIRAAGATDVGCVRERNEDAYLVDSENGLFIVADGVGGHGGGDKAAQMVTTLVPDIIRRRIAESPEPRASCDPAIATMLGDSLKEVGHRIREVGMGRLDYIDMGATVVVVLLTAHHAHIAHMGDSRAYLLRAGRLRQITEDHSIVGLLLRHREITPRQAANHPAKGRLSRFAGMEADVPAATQTIDLLPGDRLLLCTDGVWGLLPDAQIEEILAEGNDPEVTSRSVLEASKQAGGQDNITAVITDFLAEDVRDGEVIYHGWPCPHRLWKSMQQEHADALIKRGVLYMKNQLEYRKEVPPRGDPKEGMLEFASGGAGFCAQNGNHVHVWCVTTENDPERLFKTLPEYDAVVEIRDCRELFRRVVKACRKQRVDYAELHAGFARYDRGQSTSEWPTWEHGYFQKGLEYESQKEYRFALVVNLIPQAEVLYQEAISVELGDCRDLVRLVATRNRTNQ